MRITEMENLNIRRANTNDLPKINQVIESAVMNWPMPTRLKRLATPALLYNATDLKFLELLVATYKKEIIGVAAWDAGLSQTLPNGKGGLFHGLYVLPLVQRQGVGERLMEAVFDDAKCHDVCGLLIKSQNVSRSFFESHKLPSLAANDNDYPWQYWKQLA